MIVREFPFPVLLFLCGGSIRVKSFPLSREWSWEGEPETEWPGPSDTCLWDAPTSENMRTGLSPDKENYGSGGLCLSRTSHVVEIILLKTGYSDAKPIIYINLSQIFQKVLLVI